MRNPCREKEQRHRVWSDSRAGHRLPKDRGHRVCTCVPIALHTAEWGTEMAGSVCAQGRCSWGALIFINNWGNGLFPSGENSVYLLIDQYWRTGWPDVYIQVTQTSSKGSIGIHRDPSGYITKRQATSPLRLILRVTCFMALPTEKCISPLSMLESPAPGCVSLTFACLFCYQGFAHFP